MNKAELIDALAVRLGDKKTASGALEALLDEIQRTVAKGGKISLAGFGVFEKRARAARTARNPRTGEAVKVKKTNVPAFRAGQGFKDVVAGKKKVAAAPKKTTKRATTAKATTAKKATTTKKAAPAAKRATATAKKTTARKTTTKAATTKKTTSKATAAKKTTAKKTAARKTAARRTR